MRRVDGDQRRLISLPGIPGSPFEQDDNNEPQTADCKPSIASSRSRSALIPLVQPYDGQSIGAAADANDSRSTKNDNEYGGAIRHPTTYPEQPIKKDSEWAKRKAAANSCRQTICDYLDTHYAGRNRQFHPRSVANEIASALDIPIIKSGQKIQGRRNGKQVIDRMLFMVRQFNDSADRKGKKKDATIEDLINGGSAWAQNGGIIQLRKPFQSEDGIAKQTSAFSQLTEPGDDDLEDISVAVNPCRGQGSYDRPRASNPASRKRAPASLAWTALKRNRSASIQSVPTPTPFQESFAQPAPDGPSLPDSNTLTMNATAATLKKREVSVSASADNPMTSHRIDTGAELPQRTSIPFADSTAFTLNNKILAHRLNGIYHATTSLVSQHLEKSAYNRTSAANLKKSPSSGLHEVYQVLVGGEEITEEFAVQIKRDVTNEEPVSAVLGACMLKDILSNTGTRKLNFGDFVHRHSFGDVISAIDA